MGFYEFKKQVIYKRGCNSCSLFIICLAIYMKEIFYNKQIFALYVLIIFALFLFTKCINNSSKGNDKVVMQPPSQPQTAVFFSQFTGTDSCASCHKNVYEYFKTLHITLPLSLPMAILLKAVFKKVIIISFTAQIER